ncbi:MBL fold metallo-hydrolase [Alphaproteobacteria bacterium]|nr:MBL fold metallo-hydrolase [Alphaproteobacteria bacterium]
MSRISSVDIGSIKVTSLLDGELVLPAEVLLNLRDEDAQIIKDNAENTLTSSNINAYLIQSGERNLLVDAGCRELFGPTCGFIQDALAEAGVSLKQVTDIFLTHLHPDHIAGTLNTDGTAVFRNAQMHLVDTEHDFWIKDNFDSVEVNGADWANLAQAVITAYEGRLNLLPKGKEIMSGVNTVAIPGHTPGHSGFRVDSGNNSLMHLGDILHLQNLQLIDPNVSTVFDIDYDTALASRKRVLDMVSNDKNLCTSGHWLTPKFGHIERHGSGFAVSSK